MRDMMDNNAKHGDLRLYKGQTYACVGFDFKAMRDGTEMWFIKWETLCQVCLTSVKFNKPMHQDKIYPTRRCKEHAEPGRIKSTYL